LYYSARVAELKDARIVTDLRSHAESCTTSGPDDALLMQRAASGDVAAFAQIYDRHAGTVLALTRRMLGASGEEHDLLHDVFLEAWLAARDYDARRASVRVWLLVRARSRALDRRARSLRQRTGEAALASAADSSAESATMPQTERQIAVRQALATLAPEVRETLELTFFEGMTAVEVAASMGVPEGTARSRLARGLETMQRLFCLLEEQSP
jgi:RNA polymerase sigma-70 factor, ECF subfamily